MKVESKFCECGADSQLQVHTMGKENEFDREWVVCVTRGGGNAFEVEEIALSKAEREGKC